MTSASETDIAATALSAHSVATLVVDLTGKVLYSNLAAQKAFGLNPKVPGSTPGSIASWQLRRMPLTELLGTASISSNWIPAILTRDGNMVHARMRGIRPTGSAPPNVMITTVNDATTPFLAHAQQIKKLNKQLALYQKMAGELQASVEISKVLERELVHRVKNNLAIVSALLNQQARASEDQIVKDELKSAAGRIRAIAVVHDILDANQKTEVVDLKEIIIALINGIRESLCPSHIRIETEAKNITVHIDVALPLALLINELVTNAIKHAFVGRQSGRIDVQSSIRNSDICIRVMDNGVGVPADETNRPRTVTALADQMGGTIECRVETGTEWAIFIPFDGDRTMAKQI
ncbi:sensor histidine kinase [Roseivivax sp. CAU 1753]